MVLLNILHNVLNCHKRIESCDTKNCSILKCSCNLFHVFYGGTKISPIHATKSSFCSRFFEPILEAVVLRICPKVVGNYQQKPERIRDLSRRLDFTQLVHGNFLPRAIPFASTETSKNIFRMKFLNLGVMMTVFVTPAFVKKMDFDPPSTSSRLKLKRVGVFAKKCWSSLPTRTSSQLVLL